MHRHRLAAIMFTDIVGYTALMGSDEKQAFETLKKNRRIHYRLIKKYRGKFLKEMGDGTLASFHSSTDAVLCAVAIQIACAETDIKLRVGIHLGDVIFEKKDVLGDGVNIASRVQGIADTGGIAISETVYNDVRNLKGLETDFMGEQQLKGVQDSLGVYKVRCTDRSILNYVVDTGELISPLSVNKSRMVGLLLVAVLAVVALVRMYPLLSGSDGSDMGKSVMVLPFDNYTGDENLDYVAAGMHSSLIGDMGRVSALRVISETTSKAYKNDEKSMHEIANELGLDAIVEASVFCYGDTICMRMNLVSTESDERQLWSQDFLVEKSEVFNLYNKVVKQISDEINVALTPEEEQLMAEEHSVDTAAWELYLKGCSYSDRIDSSYLHAAVEYFNRAIKADPEWSLPYIGLARVGAIQLQMHFVNPAEAIPVMMDNLNKGLALDSNSAEAHHLTAVTAVWTEWNWAKGKDAFERAIELNPSYPEAHIFYGHLCMILRDMDNAMKHARIAYELDPVSPLIAGLYGVVLNEAGKCQEAMAIIDKALKYEPNHFFAYNTKGQSAFCLGDTTMWFEIWKRYAWWDEETVAGIDSVYRRNGRDAAIRAILDVNNRVYAAGGNISAAGQGDRHMMLGEYEEAVDWLYVAFERHNPNLPYYFTPVPYEILKGYPEYIELMNKMGLPMD